MKCSLYIEIRIYKFLKRLTEYLSSIQENRSVGRKSIRDLYNKQILSSKEKYKICIFYYNLIHKWLKLKS